MKNADDIRTDAIALLVEKLREIGADADQQCKQHREAEKSPGALADFRSFADHREAAALHYALAYRCEQLIEEITARSLFDERDAQDAAAEEAATEAFVDVADAERYAQRAEYVDYAEAADVREIERDGERAWLIDQFDAALAAGKAMDAAEAAESGESL